MYLIYKYVHVTICSYTYVCVMCKNKARYMQTGADPRFSEGGSESGVELEGRGVVVQSIEMTLNSKGNAF